MDINIKIREGDNKRRGCGGLRRDLEILVDGGPFTIAEKRYGSKFTSYYVQVPGFLSKVPPGDDVWDGVECKNLDAVKRLVESWIIAERYLNNSQRCLDAAHSILRRCRCFIEATRCGTAIDGRPLLFDIQAELERR